MRKLFLSVFVLLLYSTMLFAETTIRITNGEWEPFMSEYSYGYGLASHIVSEAFRLEGIDIKWGFYPWIRSYKNAKDGREWDASATWWPTEKAKTDFLLSVPVVKTSNVFFHLKSYKFDWKTMEDLKGIQVGVTRGYDYGKEFMTAVKEKTIVIQDVATDEQNFMKLLAGRIDVFPNDPIVGNSQLRNTFPPDKVKLFTHHPTEFEMSTLHLIISKKSKDGRLFLEKFNSGMKKLKDSGRIDQMHKDLDAGKYSKQKAKWKE